MFTSDEDTHKVGIMTDTLTPTNIDRHSNIDPLNSKRRNINFKPVHIFKKGNNEEKREKREFLLKGWKINGLVTSKDKLPQMLN